MTTRLRSELWQSAEKTNRNGLVTYRYPDRSDERRFTSRQPLDWGDILREVESEDAAAMSGFTRSQVFAQASQLAWYAEYRFVRRYGCSDSVPQETFDKVLGDIYDGTGGFDWMHESQTMLLQVVIYLRDRWAYGEQLHTWFTQPKG